MGQAPKTDKRASFMGSAGLFILAILAYMSFRWILYEPFVIPSGSMIPTLLVNDHIIVQKFAYGVRVPFTKRWLIGPSLPKRGDVVVFRSVDQDDFYLIKRIVGLPGDHIEYTDNGDLKINGRLVQEVRTPLPPNWTRVDLEGSPRHYEGFRETLGRHVHWQILEKNGFHYAQQDTVVPPGEIFAMGDNRDHSRDSRYWGEFPAQNLIGKATWVWLGCTAALSNVNFLCDPRHIRWHNLIHRIE